MTFYPATLVPGGLRKNVVFMRFAVQTVLWWMEFVIHNKFQARQHQNLKLGLKWKYLNLDLTQTSYLRFKQLSRLSTKLLRRLFVYLNKNLQKKPSKVHVEELNY